MNYCAVALDDKWKIATIGPCGDLHPLGDIRSFDTFEEANQVARDISNGKYGHEKGVFVNMR